jgi:hemerythrin-like domain-containing protein
MRNLLTALARDHHRTLSLIAAAQHELARDGAVPSLAEVGRALRSHLRTEEEVIFTAIEALVDDPKFHVTATLRREHQALRELFAGVEAAVATDNRAGAIGDLRELAAAIATHERKEHQVLYPMAERLGDSDGSDLAAAALSRTPAFAV